MPASTTCRYWCCGHANPVALTRKASQMGTDQLVIVAALAGAVLLGDVQAVAAHDAHHHAAPAPADAKAARVTLYDNELVDSDGHAVRFKSEAVDDRIVVVDFIYTSCTTICPITSAIFSEVQQRLIERLGERFGRDVKLVSLTVDPATDTPERLKDYAASFGSSTGWLWLTGDKPKVDKVLTGFGAYAVDFTRHAGAIVVGDARSGDWTRFYGVPIRRTSLLRSNSCSPPASRQASPRGDEPCREYRWLRCFSRCLCRSRRSPKNIIMAPLRRAPRCRRKWRQEPCGKRRPSATLPTLR